MEILTLLRCCSPLLATTSLGQLSIIAQAKQLAESYESYRKLQSCVCSYFYIAITMNWLSPLFEPLPDFYIKECNSLDSEIVNLNIGKAFENLSVKSSQFVLMHPPYMDIVKFTDIENDLSHISNLKDFVGKFKIICENSLKYLDKNRYFAVVVGDVYKNSEVLPLAFYCMDMIKRSFNVKLKGIVVKNIEGNRGKIGQNNIWKYRALNSDYFIFKHEYIFVFKKEF